MNVSEDAATYAADERPLRFEARRTPYDFVLPQPGSDRQSVLAFAIRKSGSTMLFDILRVLAPEAGLTFVSIADELFLRGLGDPLVDVRAEFRDRGYCYGGFRRYPIYPVPLLDSAKSILLVRDPRDALVSAYFSVSRSHVAPGAEGSLLARFKARREEAQSTSIDEWVIRNSWSFRQCIDGYLGQQFLSRPNVVVYRYEDVIFRKRAWIADIIDWYEWEVPPKAIEQALKLVDVFPATPDPAKHIRQVVPGNHLSLLRPSTRDKLDQALAPYLQLLGYHHGGASAIQRPISR